jgi:predicted dinucleotide-binding enzyme
MQVMVDPAGVPGDHVLFVAGNHEVAKAQVVALLGSFGWPADRIVDLGDITGAGAMEQYLVLWLRLRRLGHARFNISLNQA